MISHSKPTIGPGDIKAVSRVLQSGAIAQGSVVEEFERKTAAFAGVRGGAAVSSGTAALHLGLIALGVGPGDEVILPSYVCVAPLNAIRYLNAVPVLADVDPRTGNIDPEAAGALITGKTRAIIVPHLLGHPAPIPRFRALGIPVLEDCAQAIGAVLEGRPVGAFGDLAICSFYATKVITTGEGGMVLSDSEELLKTIRDLRDYDEKTPYKTRYNYKMTDMQAAMGLGQIAKLPGLVAVRRKIAAFYDQALAGLPLTRPPAGAGCEPIFYRYVISLHDRDVEEFIQGMDARGVVCRRPVYNPLHRILEQDGCANSEALRARAVSLPIYPLLGERDRERVAAAVRECLEVSAWR